MHDRELARLEHENLVDAVAAVAAQAPGAVVQRTGGIALIATGLPLRMFNQVLVDGDRVEAGAIAAAVSMLRGRGDRFVVNLRSGTDDWLLPEMAQLGLVPMSDDPWMPGMAMHPLPRDGSLPPPPGHEIRIVDDASGVTDHVRTAAAGFEMPEEWVRSIVGEALAARPDADVYVGYTDGVPVTTGLGFRTGRTIGVYNVATLESARRRGYGAAMTMRIVDDGLGEGCDVAILQASDMGRPIYERLGFRSVVDYVGYVDADPPGGA
jgi:GNAT superfamily N-acetyltransferase